MIRFWKKTLLFIFVVFNVLLFIFTPVLAQEKQREALSNRVLKSEQKNYLTLTVENDMFGGDTDQNYTSGLRLGWFNG